MVWFHSSIANDTKSPCESPENIECWLIKWTIHDHIFLKCWLRRAKRLIRRLTFQCNSHERYFESLFLTLVISQTPSHPDKHYKRCIEWRTLQISLKLVLYAFLLNQKSVHNTIRLSSMDVFLPVPFKSQLHSKYAKWSEISAFSATLKLRPSTVRVYAGSITLLSHSLRKKSNDSYLTLVTSSSTHVSHLTTSDNGGTKSKATTLAKTAQWTNQKICNRSQAREIRV